MTEDDRRMLDFAGQWWHNAGATEDAIAREFGLSATRYWQRVNRLLDDPEATAYAPDTVNRLWRLRDVRSRRRGVQ